MRKLPKYKEYRNWLDELWHYSRARRIWRDFYYSCRNRFFRKYYLLDIKAMKRDEWYDTDYQLFHAVFQLLVNYVVEELGDGDEQKGLADLDWTISLNDPTSENYSFYEDENGVKILTGDLQANAAKKVKELYLWYTVERPTRIDPWDLPDEPKCLIEGRARTHVRLEDGSSVWNNDYTVEERAEVNKYFMERAGLEQDYEDEDTSRAQQVLAIRWSLWT